MNKYHIYEEEAKGKYSVIFKARKKKKLQFVAIKRIQKSRKKKIINEAKILTQLSHPNIIKFYDFMETKNHMWSVTQYCPGGDLLKLVEQDKGLPENVVKCFITQILKGLQYVHSKGIVTCDLKPASILLNQYGKVKIADFGSAKTIVDLMHAQNQAKKGTPCYMAPQLFKQGGQYTFQSDLWSIGCIMYQLSQGNPPFVSASLHEIAQLAQNSPTPKAQYFSSDFNNLMERLLEKQSIKRISWNEIVIHPWISGQLSKLQIPNQSHLINKKSEKQSTLMLQSKQIQNSQNSYSNSKPSNVQASHRRAEFIFQNNQFQQQKLQSQQQIIFEDNQISSPKGQNQYNFKKKQTRHNIVPQIDDSANMNLFIETISRKNLIPMSETIHHQSDNSVKPIIGNKDIQVIESFSFNKKSLGFIYRQPEELAQGILNGEMDGELKLLFDGMTGQQKYNVLGYFESIIQNSEIANYLFKPNFISFYMKLMKGYKQSSLRAKICQILGFLIRHATVIEPDVLKYGIINGLLQSAAKDKSQKVRRKAMAALGQLLFYGATQVDEKIMVWDISISVIHSLLKILKNTNEDQVVRVYCCKSIENITAQARQIGLKFAQIDTMMVLINCFNTTKNQGFRASISFCFHHIIQLNSLLIELFIEKVGTNNIIQTFKSSETNHKTLQMILWVYIMQINKSPTSKLTKSIFEDDSLFQAILSLLDINQAIVKGRVYLFIYFVLQYNIKKSIILPQSKLFHILEKQNKQGSKYEIQCLQYVLVILYENYPTFIKMTQDDIKKSIKGQLTPTDKYRKAQSFITIIYHLAICPVFEEVFTNQANCEQLLNLMNFLDVKQTNTYLQMIKSLYMQIFEKIISNVQLTEKLQQFYANLVLPFLIGKILKSSQNDIRFNCMKLLLYLVSFYLSEDYIYDSTVLSTTSNKITKLISDHLIPQLDFLLQQGQTVASMCFKLIAVLFEISQTFIIRFYELDKINFLLPFYTQHSSLNILKIVQYLVQSNLLTQKEIQILLPQTQKILLHYIQTEQDIYLEYPLQIMKTFANKNIVTRQSLDKIWQLVVPLQGHQDMVIREKSQNLIQTYLNRNHTSTKGKWQIKQKKGYENYQKFLKITGKASDPKVVASFRSKSRYNP